MDCADLPYTIDGMVPDILFSRVGHYFVLFDNRHVGNSHGIPSRMTPSHPSNIHISLNIDV